MLDFVKKKWFTHKYKSYDLDQADAVLFKDGEHLAYLSDQFKDNLDLVLIAVSHNSKNIVYASSRIKNTRDTLIPLIKKTPWILKRLNKTSDIDKELALIAVSEDGRFVSELSIDLKNDIDIGYTAIKKHGEYLALLGEHLRTNRTFVLDSIRYGSSLETAAFKTLKKDEGVHFTWRHTKTIPHEQWPTIRQALIDNPSEFLHPPQILVDLLEDNPDKFFVLAQRALTNNVNTESITNELEGIEL